MASLLGRLLFGPRAARALVRARTAELRGDLGKAAAFFAEAGRPDETARVMLLRGDAERDVSLRMGHFLQAAAVAPPGSAVHTEARRKRARLTITTHSDAPASAVLRADLSEAARELEALGDYEGARQGYLQAGDAAGQARVLAHAGDVEGLDALLETIGAVDRQALAEKQAVEEHRALVASGRRSAAADLARGSPFERVRELGCALEARRVAGAIVGLVVDGRALTIVLGGRVVVGRAPAHGIAVPSAVLSREHVAVERLGGQVVLRDLGSRNGTALRGLALLGETVVGDGLEVRLGQDVPLSVRPSSDLPGAVTVEVAGRTFVAPLGPARLGIGGWRLEESARGWVELVTFDDPPAFGAGYRLTERIELLDGDSFATAREGPARLAVTPP